MGSTVFHVIIDLRPASRDNAKTKVEDDGKRNALEFLMKVRDSIAHCFATQKSSDIISRETLQNFRRND